MPSALINDSLLTIKCFVERQSSFGYLKRADKTARNISKNTTVIIPEFKPADAFKEEVAK